MEPEDQWKTEHHDKVLRETLWGASELSQLHTAKSEAMRWLCAKESFFFR